MENTIDIQKQSRITPRVMHIVGMPTYLATLFIGITALDYHWSLFFLICIVGDVAYYFSYKGGMRYFSAKYHGLSIHLYNTAILIAQAVLWSGVAGIWLA